MIGLYTKKPVNVEAIKYTGKDNLDEIVKWAGGNIYPVNVGYGTSLHCRTLEGELTLSVGDWIIKGVKGEFYPCRDDIFKLTYQCTHRNTVPATDPEFDFKCVDCKGKFLNEKPPLVNPVDRNIGFNNALDVLLDWAERHYWDSVDNHKDLILLHLKAFNDYHQKIIQKDNEYEPI